MATSHLISVNEYLHTAYSPDVEYVDGAIEERNWGERDHSDLQGFFFAYINARRSDWSLRAAIEFRVQVREDRFRVPDVCVLDPDAPREQIVRTPPLLCIEILSPEDTIRRAREKVRDFLRMGVREVWIVDPASRTVLICAGDIMTEQHEGFLTLAGTPITIPLAESFSVLDEI